VLDTCVVSRMAVRQSGPMTEMVFAILVVVSLASGLTLGFATPSAALEDVTRASQGPPRQFISTVRAPTTPALLKRTPTRDEIDKADLKARLKLGQTGADMSDALRRYSRTPEAIRTAHRFGLSQWLDRTFEDPAMRRAFGPRLMQSLETVRQRLVLLADLTQRYPDPSGQMSPVTRPMLQELVDLHYRRLRAEMNDSREWVSTLSGAVHVVCDKADTPPQLLTRAPAALTRAAAFERLVLRMSATRRDLTAEDQQHLNAEFAALWQAVHGPLPPRH
jgi:hypothetical protein